MQTLLADLGIFGLFLTVVRGNYVQVEAPSTVREDHVVEDSCYLVPRLLPELHPSRILHGGYDTMLVLLCQQQRGLLRGRESGIIVGMANHKYWHTSQKVGKRRCTIEARFPRPNEEKADAVELAVKFLLQYFPPKRDLWVIMVDGKDLGEGIGGKCFGRTLIHVPYRADDSVLLHYLGHEWGHARDWDNESECDILGHFTAPMTEWALGSGVEKLDDAWLVSQLVRECVKLGHLPFDKLLLCCREGFLEMLYAELDALVKNEKGQ